MTPHSAVASACAILGLDPLFVASEGKLLAFVAAETSTYVWARQMGYEGKQLTAVRACAVGLPRPS